MGRRGEEKGRRSYTGKKRVEVWRRVREWGGGERRVREEDRRGQGRERHWGPALTPIEPPPVPQRRAQHQIRKAPGCPKLENTCPGFLRSPTTQRLRLRSFRLPVCPLLGS
jgi:hypothetical protein